MLPPHCPPPPPAGSAGPSVLSDQAAVGAEEPADGAAGHTALPDRREDSAVGRAAAAGGG